MTKKEVKKFTDKAYDIAMQQKEDVFNRAYRQLIVTGNVLLTINEVGIIEIANPFRGCGCRKK